MTELETLVAAVTEAHDAVCDAERDADDGERHAVNYGQSELAAHRARFSESLAALAAYASKRDDRILRSRDELAKNRTVSPSDAITRVGQILNEET